MGFKISFYLMVLMSISILVKSEEDEDCSSYIRDVKVESSLASASMLANVQNKKGSIRFETNEMLNKAETNLTNADKPIDLCPSDCQLPDKPMIVFKCVPNNFLTDYDQHEKCESLQDETEKNPFTYSDKEFDTMQGLENWFSNFSQGKGGDGKNLYERCSGQCSPQYKNIITNTENKFVLNAEVVCGHARDKKDNSYKISYSYRWVCQDV
ncbi:MAG: hypothetical protein WBD99_14530 [Thermodesulfobacteriota bacterium]